MSNNNSNIEISAKVTFLYSKLNFNQFMQVTSGLAKISDFIDLEKSEEEFAEHLKNVKNIDNELDFLLKNIVPCPFCKGTEVSFKYSTQQGHGDSGYSDFRVSCNNCGCSKGNLSNYGLPTIEDKINLLKDWNNRQIINQK